MGNLILYANIAFSAILCKGAQEYNGIVWYAGVYWRFVF